MSRKIGEVEKWHLKRERERDVLWFKESQERSEGRGEGDEGVAIMSQICKVMSNITT